MKSTYFITATGTDLGKTWLTAGIVQACRARGQPVRALKPVMSGYDQENPAASDAGILLEKVGAGGTATDIANISPWRFAAPLSPDLAAAHEGRQIDFAALVGWCSGEIAANDGLLLIEGIGGAMVPLDARHTVRDWIAALQMPTLLVCGTYLGSLSHTLTALAALREVGIVPAALIVNESADSTVTLEDTLASLTPHIGAIPMTALRRNSSADIAALTEWLFGSA